MHTPNGYPVLSIMKRSSLSTLFLLCIACLLYLVVHSNRRTGRRSHNTSPQHGETRRQLPRQHPGDRSANARGDASCNALGIECASTYFSPWSLPKDGACTLSVRNGYPVPDPHCTPGGIVPHFDADTLRDERWRTSCVRNCQSTEKQKHVAYAWYGLVAPTQNDGPSQVCELDHLVPLELGGADGMGNIWPQCGPTSTVLRDRYFKRKDIVENYLAARVRAGQMPLEEAQRGIAKDWTQYLEATVRYR